MWDLNRALARGAAVWYGGVVLAMLLSGAMAQEVVVSGEPGGAGEGEHQDIEPTLARVKGERAGVYVLTNAVKEAVAWLNPGSEVWVKGGWQSEGLWLEVERPFGVALWIYRELVRDGVVRSRQSTLRTGPGVKYQVVSSVERGTPLKVQGVYGDWLRITPPEGTRFWVLQSQVEPAVKGVELQPEELVVGVFNELVAELNQTLEGESKRSEGEALGGHGPGYGLGYGLGAHAETRRRGGEVGDGGRAGVAAQESLGGMVLQQGVVQGEVRNLTGMLDLGSSGVDTPYTLIRLRADRSTAVVCHLLVARELAEPLIGAQVVASGSVWLVEGVVEPVVVVEGLREVK